MVPLELSGTRCPSPRLTSPRLASPRLAGAILADSRRAAQTPGRPVIASPPTEEVIAARAAPCASSRQTSLRPPTHNTPSVLAALGRCDALAVCCTSHYHLYICLDLSTCAPSLAAVADRRLIGLCPQLVARKARDWLRCVDDCLVAPDIRKLAPSACNDSSPLSACSLGQPSSFPLDGEQYEPGPSCAHPHKHTHTPSLFCLTRLLLNEHLPPRHLVTRQPPPSGPPPSS